MRVRHVRAHEADRLRDIRLLALKTDPSAYGSTYERELDHPPSWWAYGASRSDEGVQRYFVVEEEEAWLGLALVREDDEAPGDAVINAMWVAPEARGRGAGRMLCDACVTWAAEHGLPVVRLSAKVFNGPAISLYESCGFVREGIVEDEYVFARRLR
jgi:ribosomal protein S18 acetylase RimI-like enzyme